jgi:hypothetical protein
MWGGSFTNGGKIFEWLLELIRTFVVPTSFNLIFVAVRLVYVMTLFFTVVASNHMDVNFHLLRKTTTQVQHR